MISLPKISYIHRKYMWYCPTLIIWSHSQVPLPKCMLLLGTSTSDLLSVQWWPTRRSNASLDENCRLPCNRYPKRYLRDRLLKKRGRQNGHVPLGALFTNAIQRARPSQKEQSLHGLAIASGHSIQGQWMRAEHLFGAPWACPLCELAIAAE